MTHALFSCDSDILELIGSPKCFKKKPSEPLEKNRCVLQKFEAYGMDAKTIFPVFVSYSVRMPMDFSIGLMLGGDFLLYRCNGFHGTTKAGFYTAEHHAYPHAHTLTLNDVKNGRGRNPSCITDLTGHYIDLPTARSFFFKHCGVLGYEEFFADFT